MLFINFLQNFISLGHSLKYCFLLHLQRNLTKIIELYYHFFTSNTEGIRDFNFNRSISSISNNYKKQVNVIVTGLPGWEIFLTRFSPYSSFYFDNCHFKVFWIAITNFFLNRYNSGSSMTKSDSNPQSFFNLPLRPPDELDLVFEIFIFLEYL